MKNENQARLMRKTREKLGLTSAEMARVIGLDERPGIAFVSAVEHGKSGMAPHRWRYLHGVVTKEEALQAYIDDKLEEWERKYAGA